MVRAFRPRSARFLGEYTLTEKWPTGMRQHDWIIAAGTHSSRKCRWPLEFRPDLDDVEIWSGFEGNGYVRAGDAPILAGYPGAGGWSYSGLLWTLPFSGDWHWMATGGGEGGIPANGGTHYFGLTAASGTPPAGSAASSLGVGSGALYNIATSHDGLDWTGRTAGDAVYMAVGGDHGNTQGNRLFGYAAYLRPKRIAAP